MTVPMEKRIKRATLSVVKNLPSFIIFAISVAAAIYVATTRRAATYVTDGVKIFFVFLFPSLFPYLFISSVISSLSATQKLGGALGKLTRPLFNLSGNSGICCLLSLISGYPVGAKLTAELYSGGKIAKTEAERLSAVAAGASPAFIISGVGGAAFNSRLFGILLFLCHLTCFFITGIIFAFYKRKSSKDTALSPSALPSAPAPSSFFKRVKNVTTDLLAVGGIITLFYLFVCVLKDTGALSPAVTLLSKTFGDKVSADGFVTSALEMTAGIKTLSAAGITRFSLPIAAWAVCSGGVCCIIQSLAFLKNAKIKTAPFIVSRAVSGLIGFLLALLIFNRFLGF